MFGVRFVGSGTPPATATLPSWVNAVPNTGANANVTGAELKLLARIGDGYGPVAVLACVTIAPGSLYSTIAKTLNGVCSASPLDGVESAIEGMSTCVEP